MRSCPQYLQGGERIWFDVRAPILATVRPAFERTQNLWLPFYVPLSVATPYGPHFVSRASMRQRPNDAASTEWFSRLGFACFALGGVGRRCEICSGERGRQAGRQDVSSLGNFHGALRDGVWMRYVGLCFLVPGSLAYAVTLGGMEALDS